MPDATTENIPWRLQWPIYAVGFFLGSVHLFINYNEFVFRLMEFVGPGRPSSTFNFQVLYAVSPFLIFLLALHVGIMTDRLGARRILLGTAAAPFIIAVVVQFTWNPWLLIFLNMLGRLASTMLLIALAASVGRVLDGQMRCFARLALCTFAGAIVLKIVFVVAGTFGGKFSAYAGCAAWTLFGMLLARKIDDGGDPREGSDSGDRSSNLRYILASLRPRVQAHMSVLKLLILPAVLMALAALLVKAWGHSGGIMLPVYRMNVLKSADISPDVMTEIGSYTIATGYFITAIWRKHWSRKWTFVFICCVAVAPFLIWPLIPANLNAHQIVSGVLGVFVGLAGPMLSSLFSRAVAREYRGRIEGIHQLFWSAFTIAFVLGTSRFPFTWTPDDKLLFFFGAGVLIALVLALFLKDTSAWKGIVR